MRCSQRVWKMDAGPPANEKIFEMLRPGGTLAHRLDPDPLSPIFRRSMLWKAERYAPSAWVEHVPFAFWLVDALRPGVIVELGTYSGVSYSAMCQAVKSLGLSTSCFAVDTWKGDEHAGFYSEDVYRDLCAFHDRHYSAFSRLVRSPFDEALPHFADGTIDLLHIDGLHTYEAVRHDYESWLPKLSADAIVLFHDTNVRETTFAVHRLWREISGDRPHFEFMHGHGLGVLAFGADYSEPLSFLLQAETSEMLTANIRAMFSQLGGSVRDASEPSEREPHVDSLDSHINILNSALRAVNGSPRRIFAALQFAANSFLKHYPVSNMQSQWRMIDVDATAPSAQAATSVTYPSLRQHSGAARHRVSAAATPKKTSERVPD